MHARTPSGDCCVPFIQFHTRHPGTRAVVRTTTYQQPDERQTTLPKRSPASRPTALQPCAHRLQPARPGPRSRPWRRRCASRATAAWSGWRLGPMEPLRLVPSRRFENHDFRRRSSLADSSVRAGLLAKLATRRLLRDPNGTTRADIGARTRFLQRAEARARGLASREVEGRGFMRAQA